ncbi:MAG: hypothetical protein E6G37_05295 [Actinobacteria bacterium]|nr:MAG: hypothetical protein E6G63_00380 [Actinomycetota bacterium]TMK93788.1 MAG: hypothetical protein E6G37_05295 [Actinomycetota bacterium]
MPRPTLLRVAIVALLTTAVLTPPLALGSIKAGRLGIGDSVMLGAKRALHARGFGIVDAVVSRQFYTAPGRVLYWRRRGRLPRNVVIHLGNNGIVQLSDCSHAVQAAGSHRHVFLVTLKVPRSWRKLDNDRLHICARRFANAYLIDWYGASRDHPAWFASDGYHLTASGQTAYASLVARRIAAVP